MYYQMNSTLVSVHCNHETMLDVQALKVELDADAGIVHAIDGLTDGWRCNFRKLPFQTSNTQSLKELMLGFFEFLAKFDYGVDVMCVLTGEVVPRWRFLRPETLPEHQSMLGAAMQEGLTLYVESVMCVQDPFEMCHNTTRGMSSKTLMELTDMCQHVAQYCASPEANKIGRAHV